MFSRGCETTWRSKQIVAEAVADLRHFSGSRRGMKPERNSQFLQGRPHRIEIARVPRHIAQRLRPGEHTDKPQLADGALRFLDSFVGIVERDHPDALQTFRVRLAEIIEPVVVGARNRRGKLGVHIVAHHNAQADGRIKRCHVQALAIHRLQLRLGVEALSAIIGDLFINSSSIKNPAAISRLVTFEEFSLRSSPSPSCAPWS